MSCSVTFLSLNRIYPFCLLLFFFFFKQKTAYEMRISDWSSDVCSSDLPVLAVVAQHLRERREDRPLHPALRVPQAGAHHRLGALEIEIGRASWRGRVGKYV